MAAASEAIQSITRLTPLAEVLAGLNAEVKAVTQRPLDLASSAGRVLAIDTAAPTRPNVALALIDGWALNADATVGAGGYAPAQLPRLPTRVDAGQQLPADTDSVAPLDAVKVTGRSAEALVTINPGDGVLAAGGDCDPAIPLRRAGERLRLTDIAVFAAAGLARVTVREPRVRVLPMRGNGIILAAARLVAGDIDRRGGLARLDNPGRDFNGVLGSEVADAIVTVGGTGSGRNDASVRTLIREGRLAVHGIALTPGDTGALGYVGVRPILMLPGRLDAALSVWLTIGRPLLRRLSGVTAKDSEPTENLTLTRKIASTVGLSEVVPVRRDGDKAEPLASKYLPLSALARADGWVLVPADSEGYADGAQVEVRPWP
jgi:molybdopterin molybdotransferase